jgi:hypothetical protein
MIWNLFLIGSAVFVLSAVVITSNDLEQVFIKYVVQSMTQEFTMN